MTEYTIVAWYRWQGRSWYVRFNSTAASFHEACEQVRKHMLGGFGLPGENWIIPDRVLISV